MQYHKMNETTLTPPKNETSPEAKKTAFSTILPIRLVSEANSHEHWSHKRKRHHNQAMLIKYAIGSKALPIPCTVQLIRLSPRQLDEDNLMVAFKWIRDAVAEKLLPGLAKGRADGDPRITWRYGQERAKKGEFGVKIIIESN